ncbi:MAG: hypothetical protein JNL43_07645 [Flavobacteriales bacterium]|nr:hypothetical protein [Flavobacteriales bacterium]
MKPSSGKYFGTINPANEHELACIANANEADVGAASVMALGSGCDPDRRASSKDSAASWYCVGTRLQAKDLPGRIVLFTLQPVLRCVCEGPSLRTLKHTFK